MGLLAELKLCRNLKKGKSIHAEAIQRGSDTCRYIATALVSMYSKCGSMFDARRVFDNMHKPDVVSWTALILGYAENGEGSTALEMFAQMKSQGCEPNSRTFVAALKSCTALALEQDGPKRADCLELGKQVHAQIGLHLDMYVQSSLIYMYAKCGSMPEAQHVFDAMKHPNVVSWTALILGYAENGKGSTAMELFARMKFQGCAPNSITYVAVLKACSSFSQEQDASRRAECLEFAKRVHSDINCHSDLYVQSILIDVYANCGSMRDAHQVFDRLKHPDVVTWTALISGYADNGEGATALDLLARMRFEGCAPNSVTFVAAVKACASLGALESGRRLHLEMDDTSTAALATSLVDFYSKCGSMVEAQNVFDMHPKARDIKTWTALLAGYSQLGDIKAVFRLFESMQDADIRPNSITLLCVLSCCSHAGLVEKATECFESISIRHAMSPTVEHYNCMLDILGRSNKLDDAVALLRSMPCRPDSFTWMTVLGACRIWKIVGVGCLAFKSLVSLEGTNAAAHVLMAHIFGSRGMWKEQELVLAMKSCLERAITPR